LVNNDVMLDKNWLKELVKEITSNDKIGGVGGKILFFNGRIQSAGQIRLEHYKWTDIGFKEKDQGQYDKKKIVVSLSGAAVLYRKKCILDVGGFDEDFRMYCDEADLGLRARKKGWKLVYVPTAVAHHKFMATAGKKTADYYSERNRLLLIAKYEPALLFQALPKSNFFELATPEDIKKEITLILDKTRTDQRELYPIFAEFLVGVKALMLDRKQQMKKMRLMKNKVIHHRNKLIRQKEKDLKNLRKLQFKNENRFKKALAEKEKIIRQQEKSLKEIYNSRGWKLLTKVHNTKKRLGMIK
jgi:hypothetical protein